MIPPQVPNPLMENEQEEKKISIKSTSGLVHM